MPHARSNTLRSPTMISSAAPRTAASAASLAASSGPMPAGSPMARARTVFEPDDADPATAVPPLAAGPYHPEAVANNATCLWPRPSDGPLRFRGNQTPLRRSVDQAQQHFGSAAPAALAMVQHVERALRQLQPGLRQQPRLQARRGDRCGDHGRAEPGDGAAGASQ